MTPFTAPNVAGIESFCRAANYVALTLLYMRDNVLIRRTPEPTDFKKAVTGHWGVCPAVNAVYAQVSDYARRQGREASLVVGPGHAGPAVLACLFLAGLLTESPHRYKRDEGGLTGLARAYGSRNGLPTEVSPSYPMTGYVGGELGPALAFSQGTAIRDPHRLIVTLIGDGELETSLSQSSFLGFDLLSRSLDGRVLPVINLNGYRMGSRSLWSLRGKERLELFFRAHGLTVLFADGQHSQLASVFDTAFDMLYSRSERQPVIVLETQKGWTGPTTLGGEPFLGTARSHKPTLRRPAHDEIERREVLEWMLSYDPASIFDADGRMLGEVLACLPPTPVDFCPPRGTRKTGRLAGEAESAIAPATRVKAVRNTLVAALAHDLRGLLLSPDELTSNRMVDEELDMRLRHSTVDSDGFSRSSQAVEVLNESLCFAWAQGLAFSGGTTVIVSYEAFASVFQSQADQVAKVLDAWTQRPWSSRPSSVNIILTSLGWYNTPTHHNPGFVDSLLLLPHPSVKVYMPVVASSAAAILADMLASRCCLNVMVFHKHPLTALDALEPAPRPGTRGRKWTDVLVTGRPPQATLVALGDIMAEQAVKAASLLPWLAVRVVAIEDLSLLHDDPGFRDFCESVQPISVWLYNGSPNVVRACLQRVRADFQVFGYEGRDLCPPGEDRLSLNGLSPEQISNAIMASVGAG